MFAFLIPAIAFLKGNRKIIVGALLAAPAIFLLGQCSGQRNERAAQAAAREKANVEALKVDAVAKDKASEDRVIDAIKANETKKELYDEIAKVPDSVPGPARVALGCQRLRNAGTREADLPSVCRPASGH